MLQSQFDHGWQSENNGLHVLLRPHGASQPRQAVDVAPPVRLHLHRSPQAALHHHLTEASAGGWSQHALAVRAVPQPQQGPAAVPAGPQVVCCVDDLDAQVQRLQEDSCGQKGARQTGHHQFRIRAKRFRVLPGPFDTLLRRGGYAAPQKAAVREGEEAAVEQLHHVFHHGVRAEDVERHVQEELPHYAGGPTCETGELCLQHGEGGVTAVAQDQVKGLCGEGDKGNRRRVR